MGKRSAAVELFLGNMGSIQRETRPSIQREDQLTMEAKLEQLARLSLLACQNDNFREF
jgi:RNA-directed DNA polymerase